jgi:hypothetical protein
MLDPNVTAGQPRKYKDPKRVSLLLDRDICEAMNEIRWRERKSLNEMINRALTEYVKAHGAGNDTFKLDNWNEDPTFQVVPTIFSDSQRWFEYLKDCNKQDLLKILKHANTIRQHAISLDKQKRIRK